MQIILEGGLFMVAALLSWVLTEFALLMIGTGETQWLIFFGVPVLIGNIIAAYSVRTVERYLIEIGWNRFFAWAIALSIVPLLMLVLFSTGFSLSFLSFLFPIKSLI